METLALFETLINKHGEAELKHLFKKLEELVLTPNYADKPVARY